MEQIARHAGESSALFGSAEELTLFGEIFLGSLIVYAVVFSIRHFTKGLPLPGTSGFDWTTLFLGLWCYSGMAIDGWGHMHGAVDDSFFTPWHAIWYSGFFAYSSFIIHALYRLHEGVLSLTSIGGIKQFFSGLPAGYGASVAGMVVFAVAGFGDMLWHTFLGLEGGTDILLSTTHLGLAAGLTLTIIAPFWGAWNVGGSGEDGLSSQLPMLFGLGAAWSVTTLFTSYAHHMTADYSELCAVVEQAGCQPGNIGLEFGVSAILLQSVILTAVVFLFMRRWTPVFGTFTVLLAVNGVAIAAFAPGELAQAWKHLIVPVLAGLSIDLVYRWINPFESGRIRIFGFLVPAVHTFVWLAVLSYFVDTWQVAVVDGYPRMFPLGWSVHATIGSIFLAGCVGALVSLVMAPPPTPAELSALEENW